MEEQGITSRTVSTRPDTPSEYSTRCGGPLTTAQRPSWEDLKIYQSCVMSTYYMALNAGGWQRATSPSCQSSTHRTSGESCESFGLTPSPTNSYSPAAIKTAWRPSSCELDWARHEERAGQHHSHSPSLDTWRKAQEEKTKKHLAPNCGGRAQDHATHLGYHPEAGPEPTDEAILRSRPTCHTA